MPVQDGAGFSANTVRVSNASSDFDGNLNGPGDYSGNARFGLN